MGFYNQLIMVGLFALGAISGSFVVATVWRLRARELVERKRHKADYPKDEYQRLVKDQKLDQTRTKTDRSRCLSCGYGLRWFDLIPIVSWLWLRGRCRKCQARIGWTEILTEVGLGALFAISWWFWWQNYDLADWRVVALLVIWLTLLVCLAVLFVYDLRWQMMPSGYLYAAIGLGLVFAGLTAWINYRAEGQSVSEIIRDYLTSGFILAGIYGLLNLISRGQWIGSGDVFLGLALALVLGHPLLAFIGLFLANLIGTILILPGLLVGKIGSKTKLPMGPLLIAGCLITFFFNQPLVNLIMGL